MARAALDTPVGRIVVVADRDCRAAGVLVRRRRSRRRGPSPAACWSERSASSHEYFAGTRRDFDVPVDLASLEPATRRVLLTLQEIPYGRAVTYGELAALSGTGLPARAIGSVMGANPVPILIGCHRVLAGDGLGGYSGGPPGQGLETKRWLLEHEEILPPRLW